MLTWPDQDLEFVADSAKEPTWLKLRAVWDAVGSGWRLPALIADVAVALIFITFIPALLVTADILTRLPLGRIDVETTANIGWMEGGLKRNIIPERASLDGEFRSRSNDKLAWLEGQFRKVFDEAAARYPDARIELDIRNTYQAYQVEQQHETVAAIGRALDTLGLAPALEASGGGSDANVFIERGITALPVGIGVRSFHTTWETALISEVMQGAEMCQAAILDVGGNR